MNLTRVIYFLSYESARLQRVWDRRVWHYVLSSPEGDILGIIKEEVVEQAIAAAYVRPRWIDDTHVAFNITPRGYNHSPVIKPPAFPAIAPRHPS